MTVEDLPQASTDFSTVERIAESRGGMPQTVDDLDSMVEAPLLPAARLLYEKGIRTTESTANPVANADGTGLMTIDYDSLSADNKAIADRLTAEDAALPVEARRLEVVPSADGYTAAVMQVPLTGSVEDIAAKATAIAESFVVQPMTWAPRYTLEELKQAYAIPEDEQVEPADFEADGLYYDQSHGLFFLSEDHARRAFPADEQATEQFDATPSDNPL
jgi:hypothetical protein